MMSLISREQPENKVVRGDWIEEGKRAPDPIQQVNNGDNQRSDDPVHYKSSREIFNVTTTREELAIGTSHIHATESKSFANFVSRKIDQDSIICFGCFDYLGRKVDRDTRSLMTVMKKIRGCV